VVEVVRDVKGPRPVLSREAEAELTPRQRELLDLLHDVFADGFAHLTMADMAAAASCSLRTLYELAPSKDELVRLVVDRRLWGVGRSATAAITDDMEPLDAIRAHLRAAHLAVADMTEAFATDSANDAGTAAISAAHARYLVDVTGALLDEAVERGQIPALDTAAVARTMANVGADLSRPDVLPMLRTPPRDAADAVVDVVLRGLRARPTQ
jgi:AcrR family transcriptional regulator